MLNVTYTKPYLLLVTLIALPMMGWLAAINLWYLVLVLTQIPYLLSVAFKAFPEKHNE